MKLTLKLVIIVVSIPMIAIGTYLQQPIIWAYFLGSIMTALMWDEKDEKGKEDNHSS